MDSLKNKYTQLTIEEALSAGTFAEVYKGTLLDEQQQSQTVAVKVMKKKWIDNKDLINRLEDEANLLNQLQHPNIVPVHEIGQLEDGRFFFTMKEIKGTPFKRFWT